MIQAITFYSFALLCVVTALVVIMARHPITSVLNLVLCMFSLAGLFVLCEAYFVAAIQVIVYAGAVMVLFLFVVMLLGLQKEELSKLKTWTLQGAGAVVGVLFLVQWYMTMTDHSASFFQPVASLPGNIENIGKLLFTKFLLPFEVSSVLLLAAIIGAIVLAKKEQK